MVRSAYRGRRMFRRRASSQGGARRPGRLRGGLLAAGIAFVSAVIAAWFGLSPHLAPQIASYLTPQAAQTEQPALPAQVAARAAEVRVVDGDTLRVGAVTVRLAGLDAPERGQRCQRADGQDFDCGAEAARQMSALVLRRGLACEIGGADRYGRAVGVCRAGEVDIAEALVARGWAIAAAEGRGRNGRYAQAEQVARTARRGLWDGRFETPQSWRRSH